MSAYTGLITSEHSDKPKFVAMVGFLTGIIADISAIIQSMPTDFDLDAAVGAQLDAVGVRVGQTRNLTTPLTDVYFSLDMVGLGLDESVWLGPYDPTTGLVALPDDAYRTLLRAVIAANNWDGTIPGAYAVWSILFPDRIILIQDNGDMTMDVILMDPSPDSITKALLTGGYLSLRPAGVGVRNYILPSVAGPIFGLDVQNENMAGVDFGVWGTALST